MKYTVSIILNLSRRRVIELFDNPENMYKWQPSLLSFKHTEGEHGKAGSKYLMKYKMGKKEVDMVETIITRNLPEEFSATYEAKSVWNEVNNYFAIIDGTSTRWTLSTEFRFKGFMKIMAFFIPGVFKKQSLKHMNDFKAFAEGEKD